MNDITTLETTITTLLNGYPANDDTDIGLIEADLELIKEKLSEHAASDSVIDKIYTRLDTKAAEGAMDKIVEIITTLKAAAVTKQLVPEKEFYTLVQSAFEDLYYEISIEDEVYITLKFELPSRVIGISEEKLAELLD